MQTSHFFNNFIIFCCVEERYHSFSSSHRNQIFGIFPRITEKQADSFPTLPTDTDHNGVMVGGIAADELSERYFLRGIGGF